ncbi:MAG: NAD kinase [Bacteroidales bacterium]|jgi:NAD+ kinase|nr:NAD kinase [Bacteroidales bacterium]
MKIAVFGNTFSMPPEKLRCIRPLLGLTKKDDLELFVDKAFYQYVCEILGMSPHVSGLIEDGESPDDADIALSIGGDGTFLRTATRIGKRGTPILGINAGHLGFLADVSGNETQTVMLEILAGKYTVEKRTLLKLTTSARRLQGNNYAINEVAVLKTDNSSMITIHAYINNNYLNSYRADGLLIATPTGSTAYSMSVGGPIIEPTAANFVISPIAPHSLNTRPLVITDDSIVSLQVGSRNQRVLISLDGRSEEFECDVEVTVKKASHSVCMVKRLNHTFYDTIRTKLMWGADNQ